MEQDSNFDSPLWSSPWVSVGYLDTMADSSGQRRGTSFTGDRASDPGLEG